MAANPQETMNIEPLLKLMVDKNASDLFFAPMAPLKIKIEGRIMPVNDKLLSVAEVEAAVRSVVSEDQWEQLLRHLELDFAVSRERLGRFRVNAFHQRGTLAMCMRYIQRDVPHLADYRLPKILDDLIMHRRGLLLMVGANGSGKSTTLAAMINERNEKRSDHILTIEDPIEFLHSNKNSIVNQREIGQDTASYKRALRSAVREAPDVVLIGEIRDRETMEAALNLAGTGHLTISTLHANNSSQTLDRIINMFPEQQHKQVLMDLSQYLIAIVCQRLIIGKDAKRLAAVEVMLNTSHIAELILKGEVYAVKEAMVESQLEGMQDFDLALYDIYKEGLASREEVLANADSRANLEARLDFGV